MGWAIVFWVFQETPKKPPKPPNSPRAHTGSFLGGSGASRSVDGGFPGGSGLVPLGSTRIHHLVSFCIRNLSVWTTLFGLIVAVQGVPYVSGIRVALWAGNAYCRGVWNPGMQEEAPAPCKARAGTRRLPCSPHPAYSVQANGMVFLAHKRGSRITSGRGTRGSRDAGSRGCCGTGRRVSMV